MDMQGYSKKNNGYKYICVIIDCFTKFVWIKPLKSKTAAHVVKGLSLLLMTERPNLPQADQGTEFFSKGFSKMLEAFGPKLYHTYSDKKARQVERVQRTIKQRLGRVFTLNGNNKWLDIIDDVISSYNNSYHQSIKMKHVDVKIEHVQLLLDKSPLASKMRKNNLFFACNSTRCRQIDYDKGILHNCGRAGFLCKQIKKLIE